MSLWKRIPQPLWMTMLAAVGLLVLTACAGAPSAPQSPAPAPTKASPAAAGQAQAPAADPKILMKSLGTTENIDPITLASLARAGGTLSDADRNLALKCWKDNVCETGRGKLTVAFADGFGENVWRRVTAMEFILEALSYPDVKKIIYTSARGDATKAISDMRSLIAQKVDIIITFPDAGEALLPTVKEATQQGILVVPFIAGLGGNAGKDYLTFVAEDLCELGNQFAQYAIKETGGKGNVLELGGTPGNQVSATWQKCAEQTLAKEPGMKVIGKADTNWTQEGTFQAVSAALAQNPKIDAILYEYADGFLGGVRAYQQANRPLDVVLTLRTDEQGLFLEWEKANNPNFKIFMATGGSFQSRIALTAAIEKLAGKDVPARVTVPFKMRQLTKGMYDASLPPDAPVSSAVQAEVLKLMFKQ